MIQSFTVVSSYFTSVFSDRSPAYLLAPGEHTRRCQCGRSLFLARHGQLSLRIITLHRLIEADPFASVIIHFFTDDERNWGGKSHSFFFTVVPCASRSASISGGIPVFMMEIKTLMSSSYILVSRMYSNNETTAFRVRLLASPRQMRIQLLWCSGVKTGSRVYV